MVPIKSNTADTGCSPVSSNCVIWQGPAIACINLCNGDSVSEVVYKLGTELCALQAQLDLTDLDFDCLVSSAVGTPQPEHTLAVALELLINKVCSLNDLMSGGGSGGSTPAPQDPVIVIPQNAACFITTDENGASVTQLPTSTFIKRIAVEVCSLRTTSQLQTTTLSNHATRIVALEARPAATALPQVTPSCTFPTTADVNLDVAWEALEQQFCQLRSITGMPTALSAALTYQCAGLSAENALSRTGTMSSLNGWRNQVGTVADALTNLFITVCDMRAAVKDLALNGVSTSSTAFNCSSVIVDFTVTTNAERTSATIFFAGLTTIANDVTDCTAQGAKVTVTDSSGARFITYVNVSNNKANTNGVTFSVPGLNPALNYTFLLEACFTKNGSQCNKVVTKTALVSCAVVTNVTASFV